MRKSILIMILCLLSIVFYSTSIYAAETRTTLEVITLTNSPAERIQLDELKHSAKQDGITLEQALDDYFTELISKELSDDLDKYKELHSEDFEILLQNVSIDNISLPEIEDLKAIAKTEGLRLDEAIDRYAWQTQFNQVANELEEKYPDTFAGAVLERDGSSAWFAFKHDIPKQAIKIAADLPASIKLIGNRGFSEKELKSKLDLVHYNTLMHEDISNVYGYYDIETGLITIESQLIKKISAAEREKIKSQIQQNYSKDDLIDVNIKFTYDIQAGEDRSNLRGGAYLGSCTTGFNLKNGTGAVGVATAHHCSGSTRTYENHFSGSTTLNRIVSHAGVYGDLAMYSNSSMNATPFFYTNYNTGRLVTKVDVLHVGTRLCKFGKNSGNTCDRVYKRNTTRGSYSGLIATELRLAEGGDSGGPWFYGGSAIGIHSGYATIDGKKRDQFSSVVHISSALNGYSVITE